MCNVGVVQRLYCSGKISPKVKLLVETKVFASFMFLIEKKCEIALKVRRQK
jgi:hypothetical protein